MTKKVRKYGGHALLAKYGPDYFRKLANKKAVLDKKKTKLWNKMEKEKTKVSTL